MAKLVGTDKLMKNMDAFKLQVVGKVENAMEKTIMESESEAKREAPWTDRTGNARNSITGTPPNRNAMRIQSHLYIGMFYGVFLELSNRGKYRVIWPTLEAFTRNAFINNVRGMVLK